VELALVAAGGIGSNEAVAAAFGAGAGAVRIGTRFLATAEADVHPAYAAALIASGADDTVLTEAFSLGWSQAPHRVLRSCVGASILEPELRSPAPPTRSFTGDVASAALCAGTSVGDVTEVVPAATVVRELLRDVEVVLRGREPRRAREGDA
jgi:nitronate monooxygenase